MDIPGSHRRTTELTDAALNDAFAKWQDELLGTLFFLIENPDAAHDALQRTFVKCWRRRAYLAECPNLRAAVFRIALNTGRDYLSELGKKPRETPKPPSEEEKEELGEVELLRRAILGLRLEERRIFLLRQNGRLEYDEIGKTVNTPVETVKTRMRLALRKLARAVWVDDHPDRESYLELLYGILSDDEAARCRIQAESGDAAERAESLRSHIAEAARRTRPTIAFPNPADFASPSRPILRRRAARRRLATRRRKMANPWGRALSWAAVFSMTVLIIVSVGGYLYHREQLADIAEEHMRLILTGPGQLREGGLNRYTISTTSVTGRPVPVQVDLSVYDSSGDRLYEHHEKTDRRGRLLVTLPEDLQLPKGAWILAIAAHQDQVRRATTRPFLAAPARTVYLAADRRAAAAGDTVRLNATVLRPLDLVPADNTAVRFTLEDPQGKSIATTEQEIRLNDGSASAALDVPEKTAAGKYRIAVESADSAFAKTTIPLTIIGSSRKGETNESDSVKSAEEADPADGSARLDIRFYPEGGALVGNLENRVYFQAVRDGRPVEFSGRIIDDEEHFVAAVEALQDGRGVFSFVPRPGRNYRFILDHPDEGSFERLLPSIDTKKDAVIDTGAGVFEPGKPLEFNVRAIKPGLPLVVAASLRGVHIGETAFSTQIGSNGQTANPVVIEIPPALAGTIRLTLWDYSTSPPRPLGERLVYRLPQRVLRIGRLAKGDSSPAGSEVEWNLDVAASEPSAAEAKEEDTVSTEAALLSAIAFPDGERLPWPGLTESVLLSGAFEGTFPPDFRASLLDGSPDSKIALDLLLGTRGWCFFSDDPPSDTRHDPVETWPALSDNLAELQTRYLERLATYQAGRTRILNALTTLSAFGGLALLFLLGMTAMLGIPTGIRLWVPGILTACVCLIVGSILMHPDRLNENPDGRSAFATDYGTRLAGSTAKRYFRCYPAPLLQSPATGSPDPAVLWKPGIRCERTGRGSLSWTAPATPGSYRIRIDGYSLGDAGLLGTTEWTVSVAPQPNSKP